ncbi:MAG: hypothetical protein ABJE95_34635, partial [Byssovorax sp.]
GICAPDLTCADGKGCATGADCTSHVCGKGGTCAAAACDDGALNGGETDLDCGGDCAKCGPGRHCKVGGDCKSASCSGETCESTCSDGERGGAESDIDCGGGAISGCLPCGDQKACKVAEDCESEVCLASVCVKSYQWAKRYGVMSSTDLAVDSAGNSILIGTAQGAVDFGGGALAPLGDDDVVLAKIDASGNHVWSKRLGDGAKQRAGGVAVTPAGIVIATGTFVGNLAPYGFSPNGFDAFVFALDPAGGFLWSTQMGDAAGSQGGTKVAVNAAGKVGLVGSFSGSIVLGGNTLSSVTPTTFVGELDSLGKPLWGNSISVIPYNIAIDAAGNLVLCGYVNGPVDLGGGLLTDVGDNETAFVVKYDAAGKYLWAKTYAATDTSTAAALALDSSGNVVVVGQFTGDADFGGGKLTSTGGVGGQSDVFIVKLDPSGGHVWSKQFGDKASQGANGVTIDPAGNIGITGDLFGSIDFGGGPLVDSGAAGSDVFVAKLDSLGKHLWSKRFGDVQPQSGVDVDVSDGKSVNVLGAFQGTIDLGGGPLTSVASPAAYDVFLGKLLTP